MQSTWVQNEKVVSQILDYVNTECESLAPDEGDIRRVGPFESMEQFFFRSTTTFGTQLHLASLNEKSKVLDFGCGLGRVAIPLSGYLDADGLYYGVDIQKDLIESSKKRFGNKFANISFGHFNHYNRMYNPSGKDDIELLRDLVPQDTFDIAFLFSVFTHNSPGTVRRNSKIHP